MKSSELFDLPDLAHYRFVAGYYASLAHCMASGALLIGSTLSPVVCTDKAILREVLSRVPRKRFEIRKICLLSSNGHRHVFNLGSLWKAWEDGTEAPSFKVFDAEDLETLDTIGDVNWPHHPLAEAISEDEFQRLLLTEFEKI